MSGKFTIFRTFLIYSMFQYKLVKLHISYTMVILVERQCYAKRRKICVIEKKDGLADPNVQSWSLILQVFF